MSNPPHAGSSRDYAFQPSDQAGRVARDHPQQPFAHYNAEGDTTASGASASSHQLPGQGQPMTYLDFGAQHPQQVPVQGQFPGYGFNSAVPMEWDWTNSIDFGEFTSQYEPQGELVHEASNQRLPSNDFNIPPTIGTVGASFQASPQPQISPPLTTGAQNPLSPPPKPPQRPVVQTGMKRKAESDASSVVSQSPIIAAESQHAPPKRANKSRRSSETSPDSPVATISAAPRRSSTSHTAVAQNSPEPIVKPGSESEKKKEQSKGTGPQGRVIDVSKSRRVVESPGGPDILPAGKVFPIQIGSELFRLSGASISSDAPSYFSHFFGEQLHNNGGRAGDVRTLYIDRDPDTFRNIALHLQGYHVTPKDGEQFVKLYADAQFYSLPRLTKQLFNTDIFIRIGGTPFQIPRDLFSAPGDSPNYFSLGFAQFFANSSDAFPGLDRSALLRPPSISPPSAPNRNGETFGELIKLLQGYEVEIRSEEHRSQLLRDARYFHLKGLEQRLIPCEISYNLKRQQSEILVRLVDIRQSGVSFFPDKVPGESDSGSQAGAQFGLSPSASKTASPAPSSTSSAYTNRAGLVSYARPFTDDHTQTNILVLEISLKESTSLFLPLSAPQATSPVLNLRATFHNSTLARITSLFSVVASKMGLPPTQPLGLMYLQTGSGVAAQPVSPANSGVSERRVRVRIDLDCALDIDGVPAQLDIDEESGRLGIRRSNDGGRWTSRSLKPNDEWFYGGAQADTYIPMVPRGNEEEQEVEWVVKRAHWRLRVEPVDQDGERRMQVVLCAVKLEAFRVERTRNHERRFLGSV